MESFEIYFSDLNAEAQNSILDFVGAKSAADMNWDMDILPIATFDIEYRGLPYGEHTTICGEDELYLETWYGSYIEDDLQFMINALAPLGYVFNGDIHYYGDYDGKVYIKDNVVTCVDEEDVGLYEAGDETLIQMLKERGYTILKNGIEV